LQTNSYIVPKEKRAAHASLLARFKETLARLGCDWFETYEQVGTNWDASQSTGRFVQMMRFHDRDHQLAVQAAERNDREAQMLIGEFCELINFPYQQDHGFFAVGFYNNILLTQETDELAGEPDVENAFLAPEEEAAAGGFGRPTMRLATDEQDVQLFGEESDSQPSVRRQSKNEATIPIDRGRKPKSVPEPEASDIGQILDAGLLGDALDVPMPAELLEEDEEQPMAPPVEEVRNKSRRSMKKGAGGR
jgi:hypothetical protein